MIHLFTLFAHGDVLDVEPVVAANSSSDTYAMVAIVLFIVAIGIGCYLLNSSNQN